MEEDDEEEEEVPLPSEISKEEGNVPLIEIEPPESMVPDSEKFYNEFKTRYWDNEGELQERSESITGTIDILSEPISSIVGEMGLQKTHFIDYDKYSDIHTPPDCSLIDITQIKVYSEKSSDKGLLGRGLYPFPTLEDPGLTKALYETIVIVPIYPPDGQQRYLDVCAKLGRYPAKRFYNSLLTNRCNMRFYGFDPRTMRAITDALQFNTTVIELDLQDNFLSRDACYHLGQLLMTNKFIRILNLRSCNLGIQGAETIATGLLENDSLRVLDMSHNHLEDAGLEFLKSALMFSLIEYLDLSYNSIGDAGASVIGEIMCENGSIEELNVSWNFIFNRPGVKDLLKGVRNNTKIKRFDISYNALSIAEAGIRLRNLIGRSETLEYLDISGNRLNGKVATMLIRGIKRTQTLKHLKMGNNPIDPDSALEIVSCLLEPKTILEILDMENIWFNKEYNQVEQDIKEIRDCKIIIGGIYSNYEIIGPDVKKVLLERATVETMLPKKKKKRRNFGVFILKLPDKAVHKWKFQSLVKKAKLKLSKNIVKLLIENFLNEKKRVDLVFMKEYYLSIFPDTKLPVDKKEKAKKKKKKRGIGFAFDMADEDEMEMREEDIFLEKFDDIFGLSDYDEYGDLIYHDYTHLDDLNFGGEDMPFYDIISFEDTNL